jgi:LexA DNA binding domain
VHLGKLSRRVAGLTVAHVEVVAEGALNIRFTDGSSLTLSAHAEPVVASFQEPRTEGTSAPTFERPSSRQRDYLDFIRKFTARYGVPPAETDIARHFLVSAPSVNQMIKTLERRGYIARERGPTGQAVPRSIRIIGSP